MSASTAASSTEANSRQVGGSHYRTEGLQHWDLMGPEYLIGCASKYVSRHMSKSGREDLEKAIHYCEKCHEVLAGKQLTNTTRTQRMLDWAAGTKMTGYEIAICYEILCMANMPRAIDMLRRLIEIKYPERPGSMTTLLPPKGNIDSRPGTPEDGGHHARQPPDEEGEVLRTFDGSDVLAKRLPASLSQHMWQHRCTEAVQGMYRYNVSAARYLIRPELIHYTTSGANE